jgi:hypothetical protein
MKIKTEYEYKNDVCSFVRSIVVESLVETILCLFTVLPVNDIDFGGLAHII